MPFKGSDSYELPVFTKAPEYKAMQKKFSGSQIIDLKIWIGR